MSSTAADPSPLLLLANPISVICHKLHCDIFGQDTTTMPRNYCCPPIRRSTRHLTCTAAGRKSGRRRFNTYMIVVSFGISGMVTSWRLVHRIVVSWHVHLAGHKSAAATSVVVATVIHSRYTSVDTTVIRVPVVTPIFLACFTLANVLVRLKHTLSLLRSRHSFIHHVSWLWIVPIGSTLRTGRRDKWLIHFTPRKVLICHLGPHNSVQSVCRFGNVEKRVT